jgi:SM-20-related protein
MRGPSRAPTSHESAVYFRAGLIDCELCARIRAAMDAGVFEAAEVYRDGYIVDEAVRRTLDVSVDTDVVALVEHLLDETRPEVARFFGIPLRASEGPGFLRYRQGGFYRPHHDIGGGPDDDFPRRVSLVLFLTDGGPGPGDGRCQGGALRLHGVRGDGRENERFDIVPEMGTLVAFPSDVLHEVLPVTAGIRDVVVDWFY